MTRAAPWHVKKQQFDFSGHRQKGFHVRFTANTKHITVMLAKHEFNAVEFDRNIHRHWMLLLLLILIPTRLRLRNSCAVLLLVSQRFFLSTYFVVVVVLLVLLVVVVSHL